MIDEDSDAFFREIIDYRQAFEFSIRHDPVVHEIHRPNFVGSRRLRPDDLRNAAEFLTLSFLHLHLHFSVNSVRPLAIDRHTLSDPVLKTRQSSPRKARRKLSNQLSNGFVRDRTPWDVPESRSRDSG